MCFYIQMFRDSYETESMLELSETLKLQAATDVELSVTMEGPLSLSNDSCSSTQTLVTLYASIILSRSM